MVTELEEALSLERETDAQLRQEGAGVRALERTGNVRAHQVAGPGREQGAAELEVQAAVEAGPEAGAVEGDGADAALGAGVDRADADAGNEHQAAFRPAQLEGPLDAGADAHVEALQLQRGAGSRHRVVLAGE